MKRVLFTHAHLVADERREYLDGALAVEDGRIRNLFPQSGRLYGDLSAFPELDLKGRLLLPAFCAEENDPEQGILRVLRETVPPEYEDVFADAALSSETATRFARALCDDGAYKSFRLNTGLPEEDLRILLKTCRRDRLILLPDAEGRILPAVKRLRALGVSWRSIAGFSSLNRLRQQGIPSPAGTLCRGAEALLLVMEDEGELLFSLEGEVLRR